MSRVVRIPVVAPSWGRAVDRVEVILPLPPSTNHLFANVAGKGRVKTKEYRAWIDEAGIQLRRQQPGWVPGHVAVDVRVPQQTRRDIDNFAKPVVDLLVRHAVMDDDRNMVDFRVRWASVPTCLVTVERA